MCVRFVFFILVCTCELWCCWVHLKRVSWNQRTLSKFWRKWMNSKPVEAALLVRVQFMAIASYKYMTWQRGSLYIYLYSIVKILKYSDRDCHSLFIKLINKLFIHQWQVQYYNNNNNNNMRFLSLLQNGQMEISVLLVLLFVCVVVVVDIWFQSPFRIRLLQ